MRKLTLVTLVLALALTSLPAAAASGDQNISVTFYNVNYTSILGGSVSGSAYAEGSISGGAIGELRGTANLPLRDQRLSLAPTGTLALSFQRFNVSWWRSWCDQFGCFFTSGFSIFEQQSAQGPVEIRLGNMRGSGTISIAMNPVCVEACPPAGASYWVQSGYTNVYQAAVLGSQDAGLVNLNGAPPIIR
ncbi:MAG TPA: hypothetical protein VJP45_04730 [Candidatus Limnocylindria bacterium]|nr:hypothetical protein [Candidatus Limnocylindria bacterium]